MVPVGPPLCPSEGPLGPINAHARYARQRSIVLLYGNTKTEAIFNGVLCHPGPTLCLRGWERPCTPAGFYTADKMLKAHQGAQVDLIDRLPTPFGLVRSGVAPDHPETKIVVNQFSRVASHDRCSFFGNVSLGSSVSLSELRQTYDVVVLAYGSESDRSLGIPGKDLKGVYSAREFVWWYNGHPDYCEMAPELCNSDTAVVLGQGNVALDVARILLCPISELETTDIADHALDSLRKSTIRNVYLVGRRGPVQAACTAKELREILGMKNLNVHINKTDLATSPLDDEEMKNNRIRKRVYKLLTKAAKSPLGDSATDVQNLYFNGSSGKQMAVGTGEIEETKCGLVLKSIGYKSLPIDGLPFDNDRGVVPNVKGRVLTSTDKMDTKTEQGYMWWVGLKGDLLVLLVQTCIVPKKQ
ncbi:NADPH:adrenodoxin oxidoreductase [Carex littledalei]|uniref:NADPH:adrenodoxin oxidoreductase n=1 Tax=Carex littledalei TaxID=544730 RepID=A0A833VS97_9POAL|nr:NADPH:adrenodoxin oxidoreductase [Carex littledalei]